MTQKMKIETTSYSSSLGEMFENTLAWQIHPEKSVFEQLVLNFVGSGDEFRYAKFSLDDIC